MKIFVSHSTDAVREAARFKDLMLSGNPLAKVFLSSDWESIPAGAIWLEAIENALSECDYFVALITKRGCETTLGKLRDWFCSEQASSPEAYCFQRNRSEEDRIPLGRNSILDERRYEQMASRVFSDGTHCLEGT